MEGTAAEVLAFIEDPNVQDAFRTTYCANNTIPVDQCTADKVSVTMVLKTARRLRGSQETGPSSAVVVDEDAVPERRLASTVVVVTYAITLPLSSPITQDMLVASNAKHQADPSYFMDSVKAAIAADPDVAAGTYSITGLTIQAGEVTIFYQGGNSTNATNTTVAPTVKRGVTGGTRQTMAFGAGQLVALAVVVATGVLSA